MSHRLFSGLVVFCWLASMSWLIAAKIAPALIEGEPPDYVSDLRAERTGPDAWRITWDGRPIGHAVSQLIDGGETSELRSIVQFQRLPLKSISQQLLGALSLVVEPLWGPDRNSEVDVVVATRTFFDDGRLSSFASVVDIGDLQSLVIMSGSVDSEGQLDVSAALGGPAAEGDEGGSTFHKSFELPPEAILSDAISGRGRLSNLRLGQSWTTPVYRGFPPNRPVQIVEASVERHELIHWEGEDVETTIVVYRPDAGSKLQVARERMGRQWVRADGTILRQEVSFAGLEFVFERLRDADDCEPAQWLSASGSATGIRWWSQPPETEGGRL